MPISQSDQVFSLVKSLTKAEKRSFKLYIKRTQKEGDLKFAKLFELMDKMKQLSDAELQKRLKIRSVHQFTNMKRSLYTHLLTCLRLLDVSKKIDMQIRELLEFSEMLYDRGLYLQALKLLNKAKSKAKNSHYDLLHLEILEFEKRIESRHITRTGPASNEQLASEATLRGNIIARTSKFSSLKQRLHAWFIREGHAVTITQRQRLKALFEDYQPKFDFTELTFFEKVYFYFSFVWYHHILLDFENVIVYAKRWVKLFQDQPIMIEKDPVLFMRGIHHLLTACWYSGYFQTYRAAQKLLESTLLAYNGQWAMNAKVLGFTYQSYAQLNRIFWEGKIEKGMLESSVLERHLEQYIPYLDPHKIMIFKYKLAWLFFCSTDKSKALDHLNFINNYQKGHLRADIQIYTQLLTLLTHYELQNYDLLDYKINTTRRFLKKAKQTDELQFFILQLIKSLLPLRDQVSKKLFENAIEQIEILRGKAALRRSFAYLDLTIWLRAKVTTRTMEQLLQEQFKVSKHKNGIVPNTTA